ncbi:MAG: T9SS type A sorting domain-containing protein [Sphingobacteriales bacterium]|nr:T9SS type A sorting domain-containing protein [Sphingobacteriales bacterium]
MRKWFTSVLLIFSLNLYAQNSLPNYAVNTVTQSFLNQRAIDLLSPGISTDQFIEPFAVTGDYRSKQSGDWSLASTWEVFDGSSWINASAAPSNTDGNINIQNTHTVSVTTSVIADQVTVDAGGILTVSSTLALTDGTADDLTVNGQLNLTVGSVTNSGGGSTTILINGTVNWSGGSWAAINTTTIASAGIFNISGTASQLSDGTLTNNGTINWNGGNLVLSTFVINNNSGAFFNITGNNTMTAGTCSGSPCPVTFTNNGTINKTSTGSSDLLIGNNFGTIKGVGTLNCPNIISKGGTISPKDLPGIGILTINGGQILNAFSSSPFVSASNYIVEIQDASGAGSGHDQLKRAGNLTIGGTLTITEGTSVPSGSYVIISLTSGTITGTFSGLVTPPGYIVSYASTSVTVQKGTCSNPISNNIITAPAVTSFCGSGDPAVITGSTATGGSGVLNYQWQQQTGTDIYRNISGATSLNYDPPVLSQTNNYRRLVYTGSCSNYSSVVTITITGGSTSAPTITAGSATTFCSGGSVTLTSSVASGNQWYKDGVLIAGAINQTYSASASGSYTCTVTGSGCTSPASNAIVVTVNPIPAAPTISAGSSTSICAGNSVTLTSSVATGNQWYKDGVLIAGAINQTYAVSASGSYTCIVTSNGCSSAASNAIVVTVNAVPSPSVITAGSATTFCSGGSVTLTSSVASGNQWYKDGVLITGATNQTYAATASGSYTCIVTSNGCSSAVSNAIVVTVNAIPSASTITAGSATTFCSGGSVTLTSSVATGNQWYKDGVLIAGATSQTYAASASGSYTCIVTSNGCSSPASNAIVVIVNAIPSAPVISTESITTICSGGSAVLFSSVFSGNEWYKDGILIAGATASSYSAVTNGTYTATVTANGCQSAISNSLTITVNPTPVKPVITQVVNTLQSSAATGNQWYKDGVLIAGATAQTYSPVANGNYTIIVTLNGCSSPASDILSFIFTAIPDISISEKIKVYPNPVLTKLAIVSKTSIVQQTIRLLDINGKQVLLLKNSAATLQINMESFASGLYLLWIEDRKNKINGKLKIVKQ